MTNGASRQAVHELQDEVVRLLERHRVLTSLASRQQTRRHDLLEQMQHRQNLVELQRHLRLQHPADVAMILDSLPAEDRLLVFRQLEDEQAGATLVETSDAVRQSLISELDRPELLRTLLTLDADDLAFLSGDVPDDVFEEVSESLAAQDRSWLKDARFHDEDTVGRLMTPDVVSVRDTQTVAQVLEDLRGHAEIPDQTDRLFVVDARQIVRGSIPFHALVRADPAALTREVMLVDVDVFEPTAPAATGGEGVRKVRPGVGTRRRRTRQADRPRHDRSRDGLRSRVV